MMYRSNMAYKKKRSFMKKRSYKRKSYAPKKKALRRVIRKVIARDTETKTKQQFVSNKLLYPTGNVLFPDNCIPLGPNSAYLPIVQGVGQGTRIGNKITTTKLTLRGVLEPSPWAGGTNDNPRPLRVKMVIFYDREDANTTPVPGATFFQDGSSSVGFTNTLMDFIKPFNTDRYRILKTQSFKLGYAAYTGTATVVSSQGANQAYTNNDFKLNCDFSMDLTKHYPKQVKFNDNLSDPMTRGLYCLWYFVAADGSPLPSAYQPADVTFMQTYEYKDA